MELITAIKVLLYSEYYTSVLQQRISHSRKKFSFTMTNTLAYKDMYVFDCNHEKLYYEMTITQTYYDT